MSSKYTFIDHTADIAVEVEADTIEEFFMSAADALKEVVLETVTLRPNESYLLEMNSVSLENLLVNFLNELNFRLIYKEKMFSNIHNITIKQIEDIWKLECSLYEADIDVNLVKTEIKSVTYHKMEIKKKKSGFKTIIVFDI